MNEKNEGFFASCKQRGLTGQQAVVIPARNTKHLAVRREIVDAVAAGQFSIYAVDTVAEALELLTGLPAGEPGGQWRVPTRLLLWPRSASPGRDGRDGRSMEGTRGDTERKVNSSRMAET